MTPRKVVLSYPSLMAQLIIKGRKRSVELFGKEVANIVIPFNNDQLQFLLQNSDVWQVALIDFRGQILFHLPSSPILHFLKKHSVIFLRKFSFLFFSFFTLFATPWTIAHQAPLCPWNFPRRNTGVGCHFLLHEEIFYSTFGRGNFSFHRWFL